MPVIGVRQLCRQTTEVFEELERTGAPVVIARHGKPVAALIHVNESQLNELILAAAPEFVASRRAADEALTRRDVQPMSEVIAELSESGAPEHFADDQTQMIAQMVGHAISSSGYELAIESISRGAVNSAPIKPDAHEAEKISVANEELTRTVFAEALWSAVSAAFERLRLMNERLAERASSALAPVEQYAQMLDHLAEAERFSAPVAIPNTFMTKAPPYAVGQLAEAPEVDSPAEAPSIAEG